MSSKMMGTLNNYEIWVSHNPSMAKWSDHEYQGSVKALRSSKWNYHSGYKFDSENDAYRDAREQAAILPPATKMSGVEMSQPQEPPADRGRKMKDISHATRNAGFSESPEPPKPEPPQKTDVDKNPPPIEYPEPGQKTPEEMDINPEGALNIDVNTRPY
jgi:hypothetical protein